MSVKTFDFLKIQNSKLLVCEIRPVKCSIDTSAGRLKTTKWMNYQHWKELRFLLKTIAEDYETARNCLKVTEDLKYGKPQTKISDSIKIAYMWAVNKECCRHFLTPRKDTCWSDSEDDPISLSDKGGRYKSLQACGDMIVVSVALLNETEIQHKKKRSKTLQEVQSHSATSESAVSSQYLDRSLILALDPTLVQETPNISEYFFAQNTDNRSPSNSNLDESEKIKPKISTSKSRTSENAKKSQLQQPVLQVEEIENKRKKCRSFFDTDSSSSTSELPLKSSSTSSDSQAEAAASKIFKKVSAVEIELDNLITNKNVIKDTTSELKGITIKDEYISNYVYSPKISPANDYTQKISKPLISVPFLGLVQDKTKKNSENIKLEISDYPDDSKERSGIKNLKSSCSSRERLRQTPRITSPIDEICTETPEPYLKVGSSPTSTDMNIENSIDLHTEANTSNKLEIYPLDISKDTNFTRKLGQHDLETNYAEVESTSVNLNLNVIIPDRQKNMIANEYNDTSCTSITNYLRIQPENVENNSESVLIGKFIKKENLLIETDMNSEQDTQKNTNLLKSIEIYKNRKTKKRRGARFFDPHREKAHIENEWDIENAYSYLIPHTTEEITDHKLYDSETVESDYTTKNVSDISKLTVSVVTPSECVTKNTNILEETGETDSSSSYTLLTKKDKSSSPRKRSKKAMQICNKIIDESSTQNYGKMRTRSRSNDIGISTSSPDLFDDNYDKTDTETKSLEEEIFPEFDSEKKDSCNKPEQNISTSHYCLPSKCKSVPEIDNRILVLSGTPEKLSSTCKVSKLEFSPILKNRAIKRKKRHHPNFSLQGGSKRLKVSRKDGKTNSQIQETENNKNDDIFGIEQDIFEFGKSSIQSRKTLDEIMKGNNGEELEKNMDGEILNRNSIACAVPNQSQMASSQFNFNDGEGDYDENDDDKNYNYADEDGDCSNDDDYDLPDLGSAENYDVCKNDMEKLDVASGVPIEHVLMTKDKNIPKNFKNDSVMDNISSPSKIFKRNEYSREDHEVYNPSECPKASDVASSPTHKTLLHSSEQKNSNVSNSEETNTLNLESTLDSAESPDARRSQRIQSKKHCKRKSCCSGCEDMSPHSPRKIKRNLSKKKSSDSPNKNNDLTNTTDVLKKNVKYPSFKDKRKNKKNGEKNDDKSKQTDILDPQNSPETTSKKKIGSNIVCAEEKFCWGQFDSTQALLDCDLPEEWECDITKVQPTKKTIKAQAEFEKIRKNFKSRKKKQTTDITLFMDSCQVSKTAKEVKPMNRKTNVNKKKIKITNLPKNQSNLSTWITKDRKQSNPTEDEEPKASGSKDFENSLSEDDSIYKQPFSKGKKNNQKGMKFTNNTKCDNIDLSSEQTCELNAYEDVEDMKVIESKGEGDNISSGPLKMKTIEYEDKTHYSPTPSDGDESRLNTYDPSEQLDSSVQITHEEIVPTLAEKASLIAKNLKEISCKELETLVTKHMSYLSRVAKGGESNERHEIYMQGGAAARSNTPEVIFAPFTDDQLEHVHSVLRNNFLEKLHKNKIEGKEYLWMVLVPTFLIRLVMTQQDVTFEDAELLFKHMAFPKRPNRDSLGFGDPW